MNFNDLRQSPNYARYMEKIGWQVESLDGCQIFIKKIPFLGSIIKIQRPDKIPFVQLDQLGKKYHAIFVKIEPNLQSNNLTIEQFNSLNYQFSQSPMLPTKTLRLDLTPPLEKIFSQFKKDARYEIRKAEKNHLRINICRNSRHCEESRFNRDDAAISEIASVACGNLAMTDDPLISNFISLWHKNAWQRGFWIPIKKQIQAMYEAFGKDACLIVANSQFPIPNSQLLAGALIVIHDKVAYYFHAASTPLGRQLSAPYFVVWEAIKLAKNKGCQIFDFEGIYDARFPIKSWQGFTHFKKSFGGQEIEFPKPMIKFTNPVLNFLFT